MIITSGQFATLNSNIFTIIAKLERQSKRVDNNSIHAEIIKTVDFEEITRENPQERINSLIADGKVK